MSPVGLNDIIERLRNEDSRWDAILELKVNRNSIWVEPLIKLLNDSEWVVRWCVSEKLGDLADSRAIVPLIETLSDNDMHVQRSAQKALERFGSRVVPSLIHWFNYPDPRVRRAIAQIIFSLGLRAVPELENNIPDDDWVTASSVVTMMWCIGGEKVEDSLIRALSNKAAQKSVVPLLGSIKSKKCVPYLLKVYDRPSMRRLVLITFRQIGEAVSYPVVVSLVSSASSVLSYRAENIVQKIGDRILPYLLKGLTKSNCNKFKLISLIRKMGPIKMMNYVHRISEKDPEIKTLTKDLRAKYPYNASLDKKEKGIFSLFKQR